VHLRSQLGSVFKLWLSAADFVKTVDVGDIWTLSSYSPLPIQTSLSCRSAVSTEDIWLYGYGYGSWAIWKSLQTVFVSAAHLAGGKFLEVGQTQNKKISCRAQGATPIMSMEDAQDLITKKYYKKNWVYQYMNINRHIITRKQIKKTSSLLEFNHISICSNIKHVSPWT